MPYESVKRMIDSYEKFSDLDEIRKAEDPFQNKRRGYKKWYLFKCYLIAINFTFDKQNKKNIDLIETQN